MKLARFAQNSHAALEKGVLHLAETGFVTVWFLKIEKAWTIFLKRASKKRVSSKYVYGDFRKTGVRKIGVKIVLQCLHKSKGA